MAEPLPVSFLNGQWPPLREARISPLDRGFLYGDGAYEVIPVFESRPFRFSQHFDRLERSLTAIRLRDPYTRHIWKTLIQELIHRNGGGDLYIYLQVSRGAEYGRNHAPLPAIEPTVFAFCAPLPRPSTVQIAQGLACITTQDTRWSRCDIKSISLLPNVLLRQLAIDAQAQETILLRDGFLTEASTSTVHIIKDGVLITPPESNKILPGTTRSVVEEIADRLHIPRQVLPVTESQLRQADEIWLASATRDISAVTLLDGECISAGKAGPLFHKMWQGFIDLRTELAAKPW
ncbi:MAG: D-amino acid aminotransferase [Gammaproteobacteria bacterium]|nr:D-amino acid aminotransferase [Gammaproteobacteria bacterium]